MEGLVPKRQTAIEKINSLHRPTSIRFLRQAWFRRVLGVNFPTGLCAGLVQVWWSELRKGNDAIRLLGNATPLLLRDILLSQLRSVYLREFPSSDNDFSAFERRLIAFKYGKVTLSEVQALQNLFCAPSVLELDLTLQHELPIIGWQNFARFDARVLGTIKETKHPGLHLFLTRYTGKKRLVETGHRSALATDVDGACRFYDPNWGEVTFATLDDFASWFADYWTIRRWNDLAQRVISGSPPIRVFSFGSTFTPEAMAQCATIRKRIWSHTYRDKEDVSSTTVL